MASLHKTSSAGQVVFFGLVNASTGAALTSATFTASAFVTIDSGAQAGFTGTFAALGNGQFSYTFGSGECNGNVIGLEIAPSGAVPVHLTFFTDGVDANGLLKVDVEDIAGSAVSAASAQLGVNVVQINASATAAQALAQSTGTICWGTCSGGTNTTAVVSTLNNPSSLTDTGQLVGRTIIFLGNSATGAVQSEASNITASTTGSTPTITFSALAGGAAPANTDTFIVV